MGIFLLLKLLQGHHPAFIFLSLAFKLSGKELSWNEIFFSQRK